MFRSEKEVVRPSVSAQNVLTDFDVFFSES